MFPELILSRFLRILVKFQTQHEQTTSVIVDDCPRTEQICPNWWLHLALPAVVLALLPPRIHYHPNTHLKLSHPLRLECFERHSSSIIDAQQQWIMAVTGFNIGLLSVAAWVIGTSACVGDQKPRIMIFLLLKNSLEVRRHPGFDDKM